MIYFLDRHKKIVVLIGVFLLMICGIAYKNLVYDSQVVVLQEEEPVVEAPSLEEKVEEKIITVYVCGSVNHISNVTLPKDARIADAIKQAGGATAEADLNNINLAQKLNDEDMVYVPKKGETIETNTKDKIITPNTVKKSKININKASAAELDVLPGIGPSTAQKIIEYREGCGGFKSIEEINKVSGIGNEKYKSIKNLITVD